MLKYDKSITWQEFARLSIETLDLDPIYVALYKSGWDEAKLMRWCAAFVTYYHTGTACAVCDLEGDEFWAELWNRYDKNPRAAERRHFRGEPGRKALKAWINTYKTPEGFMSACMKGSFLDTLNAGIPQIGQYMTWKVKDFREAVFGYETDWTDAEKHLVGLPCAGLEYLFPDEKPKDSVWKVVDAIKHIPAPPRMSRGCGLPEAETISCMAKAYFLNGKPIGKDIVEKRDDLNGGGENAVHLLSVFPREPFSS